MTSTNTLSVRDCPIVCTAVSILGAMVSCLVLMNVAELQSAAAIVIHQQHPEPRGERPPFDIHFGETIGAGILPIAVLMTAMVRRWTLPYFLAWLLAAILGVFAAGGIAAFETYRYWRDYQPVEALN